MGLEDFIETPQTGEEVCVRLYHRDKLVTEKVHGVEIEITEGTDLLDSIPPNHYVKVKVTRGGVNPRGKIIALECEYQTPDSKDTPNRREVADPDRKRKTDIRTQASKGL